MLDMMVIYDEDAQLTYYDCFQICTKENLRECGENEPNTICKHCGVELQWAYEFYKKVNQTTQQLKNMRNILNSQKYVNQKEEEIKLTEERLLVKEEIVTQLETVDEAQGETETVEPAADQSAGEADSSSKDIFASVNDVVPRQRSSGKFSCQFCNKLFRNYSHMQKHQLIHLSDRPQFQCDSCDRIYLTKQALKVHVDTKHKKSGSACSVCGKVFAIAKALEVHMRYHVGHFPYNCNQCERKFAQRSHLNVHQQVQHSSSRFFCEFPNCGKLFTSSSALRNHECTHTEMPFECNVCQQGFPARYKLRLHAQRKHNMQLTLEQLETMRKFHIMRSKRVLAKIEVRQHESGQADDL
ncbi:hypothetical protein ACLKA7_009832 [Drosophila subpalustris]